MPFLTQDFKWVAASFLILSRSAVMDLHLTKREVEICLVDSLLGNKDKPAGQLGPYVDLFVCDVKQ